MTVRTYHVVLAAWITGLLGTTVLQAQETTEVDAPAPAATAEREVIPSLGSPLDRLTMPPRNTEEMWLALTRAVNYGRFDNAKRMLGELLGREDLTPEFAVRMREQYGSSMLLRLQQIPELKEASKKLVDLANEGSRAQAQNVERIRHFIDNLGKSSGEKGYAILQLKRSGPFAVPYFVELLVRDHAHRSDIVDGLGSMPRTCWRPVAAALDSGDERLMGDMITALRRYAEPKSVEYLWHVWASPSYSSGLRQYAAETISLLTSTPVGRLPNPVTALSETADAYYRHQGGLGTAGDSEEVWRWENGSLKSTIESVSAAQEYYGTRAAGQALELDPGHRPAQITLISLALEKSFERIGIDRDLPATKDGVLETALGAGPEVIADVLVRAMSERRTPVVLGSVRTLGQIGDRNLIVPDQGQPGLLMHAMNYPDPRVQFASALAALDINPKADFPHASRIVDTLTRAMHPSDRPVALVADGDVLRGNELGQLANELGFHHKLVRSGRSAFRAAAEVGAPDLLMIAADIQDGTLTQTLVELRADARSSGIPITVIAEPENLNGLRSLENRYRHLMVIPSPGTKENLATLLSIGLNDATAKPLSNLERTRNQRRAVDWIARLSAEETTSFDLRPAIDALISLLTSAELGRTAAETLGRLPSARTQAMLALVILNQSETLPMRISCSHALAASVQRAGRLLENETTAQLVAMSSSERDPQFRVALSRLVGSFNPDAKAVSARLHRYVPLPAGAAAADSNEAERPMPPAESPKPDASATPETPAETKPAPKKPSFFEKP